MRIGPCLLVAAAGAAACASAAHGQATITAVLVEGDFVSPVGNLTSVDNLAVNSAGQWLLEGDTNNPDTNVDGVMVKSGVLYLQEGQALGSAGVTLDSFDAVTLNDSGNSGWNFFLGGTVTTGTDSGIYLNDVLVLQEGFVSQSPAFTSPTPYIGFFETRFNNANQILVIASVDDPNIATTVDRALVRLDYNPAAGTFTENVLVKEGDTIPGMIGPMTDMQTTPQKFDLNNSGAYIFMPFSGSTDYVYLGGTKLAGEGEASPVSGRNWLSLGSTSVGINNVGGYVYSGQLDGDTATDLVIIKDGGVFRQEGDAAPVPGTFTLEGFGTSRIVDIADNGRVVWYGDWNDADTTRDTGLFVDGELLVQEGVTQVQTAGFGTLTVRTVASGQDAYAISQNGRYIIAEVVLDDGGTLRDAALLIDLGGEPSCYANCDGSTTTPVLNVADFTCFLQRYAAGESYANCDGSTTTPVLNVADFTCFLQSYAAGCP